MRSFRFASLLRFIAVGLFLAGMTPLAAQTVYRFALDGWQVVPATASTGQGWAYATLDAGQTNFTLNLTHNLANATGGSIRTAAFGSRGPVALNLTSVISPVTQAWAVGPSFVTSLNAGNLYLELDSNRGAG